MEIPVNWNNYAVAEIIREVWLPGNTGECFETITWNWVIPAEVHRGLSHKDARFLDIPRLPKLHNVYILLQPIGPVLHPERLIKIHSQPTWVTPFVDHDLTWKCQQIRLLAPWSWLLSTHRSKWETVNWQTWKGSRGIRQTATSVYWQTAIQQCIPSHTLPIVPNSQCRPSNLFIVKIVLWSI